VETENGYVQGAEMKSRKLMPYYFYGNIPYAMPPIGERRFEVKMSVHITYTYYVITFCFI